MKTQFEDKRNSFLLRTVLWSLVAIYALMLPYAISVYNAIEKHFSSAIARKVPFAIIILLGIIYLAAVIKMKKGIKSRLLLLPCAIIVYVFFKLEPNPNKHIHIPEYIVMAWLLFEVLALDYKGKGIFVLVFICSSLLGVVDELMQGLLPDRHYGWPDMVMNSAAAVIGILTLAGLRTTPTGNWTWVGGLKQFKKALAITIFGAVGAVFTCLYLFDVQAHLTFRGTYPNWLLGWNALFLAAGLSVILYPALPGELALPQINRDPNRPARAVTARLWVLCPLVILIVIHGLVMFAVLSGFTFT